MTARLIIGFLAFSVAMSGCYMANMLTYAMIGEINRRRPDDRQISYFWFTPVKMIDILDEYRDNYPEGKLRSHRRLAIITMFAGLAVTAGCMMLRFK
jgi:hypothetical protein